MKEEVAGLLQVVDDVGLVELPCRWIERLANEDALGVVLDGPMDVMVRHPYPLSAARGQVGRDRQDGVQPQGPPNNKHHLT